MKINDIILITGLEGHPAHGCLFVVEEITSYGCIGSIQMPAARWTWRFLLDEFVIVGHILADIQTMVTSKDSEFGIEFSNKERHVV